jgi:mannose-1-phosphate guanylyltransferase
MTEAVLLVGGRGTRLRPLTVHTPKPMLPTAGVPFLAHQLARAKEAGVDHVVLATAYQAATFSAHFGDGSAYGLEIDYVTETVPLGTGGGIRNVSGLLRSGPDEPIVVFNGDVLSGHDIGAQLDLHSRARADVTLHLTEVEDPRAFGCVPSGADGRVTAFLEKMPEPVTNRINAGCYVFRRAVIDAIPAGRVVSVERQTFPALLAAGAPVLAYVDTAYWLDVGTPTALVRGSRDLVRGLIHSPAVAGPPGEALVLSGAVVAPDAVVRGGACVGAGARVHSGALVEGSILMDGAAIGTRAVVRDSVVGRDVSIGAGTVLDSAVVGDSTWIGAGNELRGGVRIWCDTVIADRTVRFSSDIS